MKVLNRILLSWLPTGLSVVSALSDLSLIVLVCAKIRDLKTEAAQAGKDTSRDVIIAKMIGLLAVADIVFNMIRLCNQMPSILYSIYVTNTQCLSDVACEVVAFLDQISSVFDTLAQLVLAFAFLHLLLQSPVPKIENKRKLLNFCKHSCSYSCSIFNNGCCVLSFVFCFLISIGIATIPLFVPVDDWTYGEFFNYTDTYNNTYSCQCWILGGFEYFWIISVIAGWVLHCVVLLISCHKFPRDRRNIVSCLNCTCCKKYKKFKKSTSFNIQMLNSRKNSKDASYLLRKSLQPWVICYTITRLPIIFARLWQLWVDNDNTMDTDTVNFSLMVIHNIFASAIGIGNLITWICVQKVYKRFKKTYNYGDLNGCENTPTELSTQSRLSDIHIDNDDDDDDGNNNDDNSQYDFDSHQGTDSNKSRLFCEEFDASDQSIHESMKTDPSNKNKKIFFCF